MEMGAATFHPQTVMSVIKDGPSKIAFMQPCRRPQDGRAGTIGNRLYKHHQFQVIMMPPPHNIQEMVINSLYECGINPAKHNIDFVENNWNSPSLGATGKGYEVQVNGHEVLQFTYFQQIGGHELDIIPVELAYGIERLSMIVQNVRHFYDLAWDKVSGNQIVTYGEIHKELEQDYAGAPYILELLKNAFEIYGDICQSLIDGVHLVPAYEAFLRLSHTFNLIENTGSLSLNERVSLISRVRNAASSCLKPFIKNKFKGIEANNFKPVKPEYYEKLTHGELFVEIMAEKLPLITNLHEIFHASVVAEFTKYANTGSLNFEIYTSCSRLILRVSDFPSHLTGHIKVVKGPKTSANDEIVDKFLKKYEKNRQDLLITQIRGEDFYFVETGDEIFDTKATISYMIANILREMQCPEYMRCDNSFEWIRPIRRVVLMYKEQCLANHASSLPSYPSSLYTLTGAEEFIYDSATTYFRLLEEQNIFVRPAARKAFVRTQIDSLINDSLILSNESNDVIKHILLCSESPIIYLGDYNNTYDLPDKIRQAIMIYHQNFVPLFNKDGSLSNQFLLYANNKMDDDGVQLKADAAQILGMRLQEAEHFWTKDINTTHETYINLLRKSTFYEGLGSLYDQSKRFEFIVDHFFPEVPHLQAAAKFLNLDLCMQTVFEVPDLHGIASGLYAVRVCGQDPGVEKIIADSIYPKNEGQLPKSKAGAMLGFCVRLDQLVGFFGTNASNIAKGSSDQFGLRRAAFSLIRLGYFLRDLPDLRDMITHSINLYLNQGIKILPNTLESVMEFIQKRAVVFLGQTSPKLAQAFVSPGIITWQEDLKLDAFLKNQQTHEALMTLYKRLAGICKSAIESTEHKFANQYLSSVDKLLETLNPAEYDDILNLSTHVDSLLNNIHLNSLDTNDKAAVMYTLSKAKNIFDNYCDFKSIM